MQSTAVEDLQADINLNAKVANLVQLNAGVQVGIKKVNITIADVEAELELVVRLGNLVDIVNRVFESLDLNPLLINTLNNVTNILDDVVGAVDGLLGSITQGGRTLSFVSHLNQKLQKNVTLLINAPARRQPWQYCSRGRRRKLHCWQLLAEYDSGGQHGEAAGQRSDPEDLLVLAFEFVGRHRVQHGGQHCPGCRPEDR